MADIFKKERKVFTGVQLPRYTYDLLTLHSLLEGITRSKIIRNALDQWIRDLDTNSLDSIIQKFAKVVYSNYKGDNYNAYITSILTQLKNLRVSCITISLIENSLKDAENQITKTKHTNKTKNQ